MHDISYVLVTGATGFIGAHVVDQLLERGLKVRGTTRSAKKAQQMRDARQQYSSQLDFVQIEDFTEASNLSEAVKGVDGIIHVASPLTYQTTDNENELILPAINGVKAVLSAASQNPHIRRIVLTSSFASVVDVSKTPGPDFTYTAAHWNPLTYAEATAPGVSAVVAYRASKKFAELEAWDFLAREEGKEEEEEEEKKPRWDLVTLCPPMTFGPVRHPVASAALLNESNARLWDVACGGGGRTLPETRVPVWIDVRDLAKAHVEGLLRPEVGNKRYVPAAPEKYSYELVADVLFEEFGWAKGKVASEGGMRLPPPSYGLDGKAVTEELGVEYRSFRETIVDLFTQLEGMGMVPGP